MYKLVVPKTRKIIFTALLIALYVILNRFVTINTQIVTISFSLVTVMLAAVLLGPKYAAAVGALGDLIGALVFPFGPYFPGFTFSMGLAGLIYGLLLYKNPNKEMSQKSFTVRVILSNVLVIAIASLLLDSLWISILYKKAFIAFVGTRIVTKGLLAPILMALIIGIERAIRPFTKKYLYEKEEVDIEEYLDKFDKFTKDPTLRGMEFIMSKFGNPEKEMKYVHVAGTNGKGSVCEMLNSVLVNSGYKVGKFVSPHLVTYNDGICINNVQVQDDEAREILEEMNTYIEEYNKENEIKVKWFEVITSLSLIYFAREKCDIAIIETGMGGILDCTNIINPLVSVITNIGYDHMDILGNTIEEIAGKKAGIIKQDGDTVAVNQETVIDIIEKTCKEKNNNPHIVKEGDIQGYKFDKELQSFSYKEYKNIEINLKGKVQILNAAECLECIDILKTKGFNIEENNIREGLKTVVHRARLEVLEENPLVIFDGGHNEDAIKNLKENINQYYNNKKKVYIVSILSTKDYKTIIRNLCDDKESIYFFTNGVKDKPYIKNKDLYNEAKKYIDEENLNMIELKEGIELAKEKYSDRVILIVGSFYIYKSVLRAKKND